MINIAALKIIGIIAASGAVGAVIVALLDRYWGYSKNDKL